MAQPPLQPVRGTRDLIGEEFRRHQAVIETARRISALYGFEEWATPVFEDTRVFARGLGDTSDVVMKEMYTFTDRGGDSITLRPEMTAGVCRALVSSGLVHSGLPRKVFYAGPMFRYERPQKGRYRQFHQFDIEALGYGGPDIDAELIIMIARAWRALGIRHVELQLNSIGMPEDRARYREALAGYFRRHSADLDEDSQRRLDRNPMRILDSKNPAMQAVVAGAPLITEYLDAESAEHFATVQKLVGAAGIAFRVNPRLVRGLDYYNRTVFEWVTDQLGTQGAVCAGGRYDGLVEQLGGSATPAIGCAIGLERLTELFRVCGGAAGGAGPDVYVVAVGDGAVAAALRLAENLRDRRPGLRVEMNCGGGGFKAQMRRADASGAAAALILGEDEAAAGTVGVKGLRREGGQQTVDQGGALEALAPYLDTP
jgi:histidyl-tRNA synthetase